MKGKIFNAQEVQAIIAGNKTMFREVIKPQIIKLTDQQNKNLSLVDGYTFNNEIWADLEGCKKVAIFRCPYQVGQKIFCKETFEIWDDGLVYKADNSPANLVSKWKPAQHMKQEHSRLTLLIKEIKVERLGEISEEDCEKEGVKSTGGWNGQDYDDGEFYFGKLEESEDGMDWKNEMFEYPDLAFASLWNATHKKPEEKFEANPWVWCVTMEVVK
tara:strand:- start:5628 stop:6272 length:645 start_codon:yes stop_codon:yes gene_type:complete